MHNLMHVCFSFSGVPRVLDLEPIFNQIATSDWIRYSTTNWIIWTEKTQLEIYENILPWIDARDSILITPLVVTEMFGRQPQWVWDWVNAKSAQPMTSVPNADNAFSEFLKLLTKPQD